VSAPVTPEGGAIGCLFAGVLIAAPAYLAVHLVVAVVMAVAR
jgi:hypothetical protein